MEPQEDLKPRKSAFVRAAEYSQLGMILPANLLVGYVIGWLLDKWLGTSYLYLVFLLLGIVGGFYQLLKRSNRLLRKDRDK